MVYTPLERFLTKNCHEDWGFLPLYPFLSELFLESHLEKINWPWFCSIGCYFDNFLEKHQGEININLITKSRRVSEKFLRVNIDKIAEFSWWGIARNPLISQKFLEEHLSHLKWHDLITNPSISEEFIERHWDAASPYLKQRHDLSMEFIERNRGRMPPGLYCNITEEYLSRYPQDLSKFYITSDVAISEDFLSKNHNYISDYGWWYISRNNNLSEAFFRDHLDKIHWSQICSNTSVSEAFFMDHFDQIVWSSLCSNSNISEQFFRNHLNKVDWNVLITNTNISEQFCWEHLGEISGYAGFDTRDFSIEFFAAVINKTSIFDSHCRALAENPHISYDSFEQFLETVDMAPASRFIYRCLKLLNDTDNWHRQRDRQRHQQIMDYLDQRSSLGIFSLLR